MAIQVSVSVEDLDKLKNDMRRAAKELPRQIYLALVKATRLVQTTARRDYLSGPRPQKLGVVTGTLRRSIGAIVRMARNEGVGEVGTNVIYAAIHEFGNREAIDIFPRRKRALHFKLGSRDVFAKHVRIEPDRIRPRPFLQPALSKCSEQIERLLADAVDKELR